MSQIKVILPKAEMQSRLYLEFSSRASISDFIHSSSSLLWALQMVFQIVFDLFLWNSHQSQRPVLLYGMSCPSSMQNIGLTMKTVRDVQSHSGSVYAKMKRVLVLICKLPVGLSLARKCFNIIALKKCGKFQ